MPFYLDDVDTMERLEERLERWHERQSSHNELLEIQREIHFIRMDMVARRGRYLYSRLAGTPPSPPPYLKVKSFSSSRDGSGMSHVIG